MTKPNTNVFSAPGAVALCKRLNDGERNHRRFEVYPTPTVGKYAIAIFDYVGAHLGFHTWKGS